MPLIAVVTDTPFYRRNKCCLPGRGPGAMATSGGWPGLCSMACCSACFFCSCFSCHIHAAINNPPSYMDKTSNIHRPCMFLFRTCIPVLGKIHWRKAGKTLPSGKPLVHLQLASQDTEINSELNFNRHISAVECIHRCQKSFLFCVLWENAHLF